MNELENRILQIVYSMKFKEQMEQESKGKLAYGDKETDRKNLLEACGQYVKCNNGDCERHKLGAEPCAGCRFCDRNGDIP